MIRLPSSIIQEILDFIPIHCKHCGGVLVRDNQPYPVSLTLLFWCSNTECVELYSTIVISPRFMKEIKRRRRNQLLSQAIAHGWSSSS